jgi:alcohol dehydrogenase (cytochrome c)
MRAGYVPSAALPGGGGPTGMLTTAGVLMFSGDGAGNHVALDAASGKPLWHSRVGNVSSAPQTYMLDGKQYLSTAVGDMLAAFVIAGRLMAAACHHFGRN